MALGGSAARRYAEALLDIATEEGQVAPYRRSLEQIAASFTPAVIRALRDPRMPVGRRRDALAAAVKDEPKAIRAVLDLMIERDRLALLPDVISAYGELVDRREGVLKAKITTTRALETAEQRDLLSDLERASGKTIRATFAVDQSLIGGAKVQIGDRLIDSSLRTQLDHLARELAR
jgi:F-type H+-transporting ATPase subunit delta